MFTNQNSAVTVAERIGIVPTHILVVVLLLSVEFIGKEYDFLVIGIKSDARILGYSMELMNFFNMESWVGYLSILYEHINTGLKTSTITFVSDCTCQIYFLVL